MSILVLSDVHLSASEPALTHQLSSNIQKYASSIEALYILGDFFELSVGGEFEDPFAEEALRTLTPLLIRKVPIYWMPGNRDFLVDRHYLETWRIHYLEDPSCVSWYGKPIVLCHGDAWTQEPMFQLFRRIVRHPLTQKIFSSLPVAWRASLAGWIRQSSQKAHLRRPQLEGPPMRRSALEAFMRQQGAEVVIHGHIHCPGLHMRFNSENPEGQPMQHYVLGDFSPQGSCVLWVDSSGFHFEEWH